LREFPSDDAAVRVCGESRVSFDFRLLLFSAFLQRNITVSRASFGIKALCQVPLDTHISPLIYGDLAR